MIRWTAVRDTRVVKCNDRVNYRYMARKRRARNSDRDDAALNLFIPFTTPLDCAPGGVFAFRGTPALIDVDNVAGIRVIDRLSPQNEPSRASRFVLRPEAVIRAFDFNHLVGDGSASICRTAHRIIRD